MRYDTLTLVDNSGKYTELLSLYNSWHLRTMFMSVGNTNVEEWFQLLDYCKNNKLETAMFFLDLIDATDKDPNIADNYVGFFNDIIYECFSSDKKFPKFSGFVGGDFCQNMYVRYIKKYILCG